MKQSKRVFYFDALRAMAIIGIVFCHAAITFVVTGINNSDFYISAFFDCFRDFSIPIFEMPQSLVAQGLRGGGGAPPQ